MFTTPYYRMHLRPKQHKMLLELGEKNVVYYAAPAFHTVKELNEAYLSGKVKARSVWIRPKQIGCFPDDKEHKVAFVPGEQPHFCSNPRPLDTWGDCQGFRESLARSFKERSGTALKREVLEETAMHLSRIIKKHLHISIKSRSTSMMARDEPHPLSKIAYYSQVLLGAKLFIAGEQGDVDGD